MFKNMAGKFIDATVSTLPISLSVIIISLFFSDITPPMYLLFSLGSILLIVGLALFSLGMDLALAPIGREIGSHIVNKKKLWLLLIIPLLLGFIISIAEPGVSVLSGQIGGGERNLVIIYTIAGATGLFLLVSVLRIFLKIQLRYVFIVVYGIMLILAAIAQFINPDFVSVALDSGGVATGAITVPFLMAFTVGISSVAHGRTDSEGDEGFGTVALCTAGPVIIILIIALSGGLKLQEAEIIHDTILNLKDILFAFGNGFVSSFKDVALSLAPVVGIFVVFQLFALRIKKRNLIRIIIGLFYSYFGLVFFLTGVNVGFLPIGKLLGGIIAVSEYRWILVPLGALLGALIVLAEPSVHALTKQVNELTSGVLSRKTMLILLCIGVSIAVGISLLRVLTGISIWWFLLPIYGSCLLLTFFAPKLFTAIAFDSGGVASGPMTVTFALPFVIGACNAIGGNVFTDAFGIIASVTMAPILVIMITGVIYKVKVRKAELESELEKLPEVPIPEFISEPIVDYDSLPSSKVVPSIIVEFDEEEDSSESSNISSTASESVPSIIVDFDKDDSAESSNISLSEGTASNIDSRDLTKLSNNETSSSIKDYVSNDFITSMDSIGSSKDPEGINPCDTNAHSNMIESDIEVQEEQNDTTGNKEVIQDKFGDDIQPNKDDLGSEE
ncbi:MAG: DUF1538 domain-containing protein [Clostridiales bacterium]|jgi:hypothetical protein|nr:DUF1538 domain-containing protein [Clostridiales bacterium]